MDINIIIGVVVLVVLVGLLNETPKKKKKGKAPRGTKSVTENGELVKSKVEKRIADYLKKRRVVYVYEKELNLEGDIYKPDFYLEKYKMYIEYYGWYGRDKKYTDRTNHKNKVYKGNNISVIGIYPEDYKHVEDCVCRILRRLEFFRVLKICFSKIKSLFLGK